jgi:hypothetical protein
MNRVVTPLEARKFFRKTNRLFEEAVQSYFLFGFLRPYLRLKPPFTPFWDTVEANQDLLLTIMTSARSHAVIGLYVLYDRKGLGSHGYNLFRLIEECAEAVDPSLRDLSIRLTELKPLADKLSRLRNNQVAHLCATDDWKKGFGKGLPSSDVKKLISGFFDVLLACSKSLEEPILNHRQLARLSQVHAKRLMNALKD